MSETAEDLDLSFLCDDEIWYPSSLLPSFASFENAKDMESSKFVSKEDSGAGHSSQPKNINYRSKSQVLSHSVVDGGSRKTISDPAGDHEDGDTQPLFIGNFSSESQHQPCSLPANVNHSSPQQHSQKVFLPTIHHSNGELTKRKPSRLLT